MRGDNMKYYISSFSKLSGFSVDTLRYYESMGLFEVKRDDNNRRYYTEQDLDWIECVKKLKRAQMKIKTMKHYNQLRAKGNQTIPERIDILNHQLKTLTQEKQKLEDSIAFINEKINMYQNIKQ